MARVKLSEYRAKSLLVGEVYNGVCLHSETLEQDIEKLDEHASYIIKVDQGMKKRGKQGLLRLNVTAPEAQPAVQSLAEKGFTRFIAEPMLPHDDSEECYVSFERTRDGIKIMYSEHGGVTVEDKPESVREYSIDDVPLPKLFVQHVTEVMNNQHMSFVEINPLLVRGEECLLLDAAVLVDSAGEYESSWNQNDIVSTETLSKLEQAIKDLNNNSPASFSFKLLNPDASLWMQLMGGGACITIADEASNQHKTQYVAGYGEYSGGPNTEEIYLYTSRVLDQMLESRASKKAFIIAGGAANFSDVKVMFKGVIQAMKERQARLSSQNIKVFVRRAGPNETEGLALISEYLHRNEIFGSVHGSETVLTDVVSEALEYVDA